MGLDHGIKGIKRRDENCKVDLAVWRKFHNIDYYFCRDYDRPPFKITLTKKRLQRLVEDIDAVLANTSYVLGTIPTGNFDFTAKGMVPEQTSGLRLLNPTVAKSRIPAPDDHFFGDGIYNEDYIKELKSVKEDIVKILETTNFVEYKVYYWRSI